MKKYATQTNIHTFVIGKKFIVSVILVMAALCAFSVHKTITSEPASVFEELYKSCNTIFQKIKSNAFRENDDTSMNSGVSTIIKYAAPVFAVSNQNNETEKPENREALPLSVKPEKKTNKPVTETSIVSENMNIKNETNYIIDTRSVLNENISFTVSDNEPEILIIHSHACETYCDDSGKGLGEAGTFRSTDQNENMIKIGEVLSEKLNSSGIRTIHDKTLCDYPAYNNSYKNSLGIITRYLNDYPTIDFVFDIHRDAITDSDNQPEKLIYTGGESKSAQLMIVCGTDGMGLEHPHWRENLTFAVKVQNYLETNYPGYARPLNLRKERFNMHMTKGSLIFEIGSHGNTLNEALNSVDILAKAIHSVITELRV